VVSAEETALQLATELTARATRSRPPVVSAAAASEESGPQLTEDAAAEQAIVGALMCVAVAAWLPCRAAEAEADLPFPQLGSCWATWVNCRIPWWSGNALPVP
jgi:hypothetical protein